MKDFRSSLSFFFKNKNFKEKRIYIAKKMCYTYQV